nr:drug/metabolite transporter (DMT) superfamily permease [uncultured bacterium]
MPEDVLPAGPAPGGHLRAIVLPFIIFTAIWGSTWIVIRGQIGVVPPQWSVAYRFVIATVGMAAIAIWKGEGLRIGPKGLGFAVFLGFTQFCINFNAVYLAERHITSGVVATVFALLMIPSSLLGWLFLGQKPSSRFAAFSLVAVAGISLLFLNELHRNTATTSQVVAGIGITFIGMLGASTANVMQARPEVRRFPLFTMLTWSMAAGAVIDGIIALVMTGPPVLDTSPVYVGGLFYLALPASVLTFALYYPVIRKIGPGKTAYASAIVPVLAMGFSTWIEDYHWTLLAIVGALLALGGMAGALSGKRIAVAAPDAA